MEFIDKLFLFVSQLGPMAYWLIFLISFLESVAFLGAFFPGASLIVLAGFLSSQGTLEPGSLIIFALFGALLGDNFSYWLGTKNTCLFKKNNLFFRLEYLESGRCFLKKYKAESILLARFIGPARAIVPFVAGVTSLKYRTFFFWNFASVTLWAISHILLGHFFGASLEIFIPWIKRSNYLFVFAVVFFGFFYFGKKFLLYRSQRQFLVTECRKK